jgi:hypothetical protein
MRAPQQIDAEGADHRVHAEQIYRRPAKAVGFSTMLVDEVEDVGPDPRPCVWPEARARVASGQGEEGFAPRDQGARFR